METNWIATRLRKYIEYVFLGTNARNVIAFNYITSEDLRVYPRVCVCVCVPGNYDRGTKQIVPCLQTSCTMPVIFALTRIY